ncbi:MAG: ribbon-helix-helix protein, CopG family [Terriglobia bacterium]
MSSRKLKENAKRRQKPIAVRLDDQTKKLVQDLARTEDRSAANMIERIVKEYLRTKGLIEGEPEGNNPGRMLMTERPIRFTDHH